jgi:hypothetical protein
VSELNAINILNEIEIYLDEDNNFIDALIHYSEKYNIEIEILGEIVKRSPIIKSKVHSSAEKLNLIERVSKLPL